MGSPHFLAAPNGSPPTDPGAKARWKTQSAFAYDDDVKRWTMPSIMAGINTKARVGALFTTLFCSQNTS
jgi:hypothetical protein